MQRNESAFQVIQYGLYALLISTILVGCRLEDDLTNNQNPALTETHSPQGTQNEASTETEEVIPTITPSPQLVPSITSFAETSTPFSKPPELIVETPSEATPTPGYQIERVFDIGAERSFDFWTDRLAVSPDNLYIAAIDIDVNYEEVVSIYDYRTGQKQYELQRSADPFADTYTSMVFSSDSRWLAVGGTGRNIWIWDVASGELVQQLLFKGPVSDLAFSSSGRFLGCVSPSEDPKKHGVGVFDIESGSLIAEMPGIEATSVLFLEDEAQLLIGAMSYDDTSKALLIWNYEADTTSTVLLQAGLVQLMAANTEKTIIVFTLEKELRMIEIQDLVEIDVEEPEIYARDLYFDGAGHIWALDYDGTLSRWGANGDLILRIQFTNATGFAVLPDTDHLLISFPEETWEVAFQ